jgi:hypothetical protein
MYICHLTRQIKRIDDKHYKVHMQKNYEKKKKKNPIKNLSISDATKQCV